MDSGIFSESIVKSDRVIYTPSSFAKTNLLHLQEIGYLEALKPHISKRENLSSFLFIIVLKGTGSLFYNGKTYSLKKGDCAFIDCKKPYSHFTEKNLWHIKWVHFYGPNLSSIYDKYIQRGGQFTFKCKSPEKYADVISEIHNMAKSNDSIRDMKIYNSLTKLLVILMEEKFNTSLTPKSHKKQNLQHIKDYIDQNFNKKITLDELSEKFYINKFYLTR
ncbi:MAG: AraC family ligand binding domain-containing protein, partial [Lachnospirales bacterium]